MSTVEQARDEALKLLCDLATPQGFVASQNDIDNYKRVWGRDGVIAVLAALLSGKEDLIAVAKTTLQTLTDFQDETGRIPSNVTLDGSHVSYGTTVGRIDSTLWYVIGMVRFADVTGDDRWWQEHKPAVEKALSYLSALELNGRGLIYIPQGGDWSDEYLNEGYVLFDQLLYLIALRLYSRRAGDGFQDRAARLTQLIAVNYTPYEDAPEEYVYHKALYPKMIEAYRAPIPLASFSPHRVFHHDDIFAISLFALLGFVENQDCDELLEQGAARCTGLEFSIKPAFCPVIQEGDPDWSRLENNFLFRFKNKPYEFHNGGRWPLVHGFYVASDGQNGNEHLEQFAEVLISDDFQFPEFYHGQTGEPGGVSRLGFSAAGYLFAYYSVKENKKPFGRIESI